MLLLVLVAVVWVAWRCRTYPGGWRYAFDSAHADDRNDLARARRNARETEREGRQRVSRAQSAVNDAEARQRQRVRSLRSRIADARRSDAGRLLQRLGDLALYEHVLKAKEEEIPLDGLRADFESSPKLHYVYVTRAGGRRSKYEYAPELHEEDDVRGFALHIGNAALKEAEFRAGRQAEIHELEEELQRVREDTAEQDTARQRLAEVTEEHEQDERIKQARLELEEARDRWQALTGRRPPRR
ncbi:hypothetical protein ACF061_04800 [Streptomyces sp. NPDC015220]|uniref:hypothetical protein n=1 Tax=Streptomyces sp. NPDC015220 TaxID=3364947 RepID=UPI0036F5F6CB